MALSKEEMALMEQFLNGGTGGGATTAQKSSKEKKRMPGSSDALLDDMFSVPSMGMPATGKRQGGSSFGGISRPMPRSQASGAGRVMGALAFLFGGVAWLEGARFTRDGWIQFVNGLCYRLYIPWQVPELPWWAMMGLMFGIALAYSHVELNKLPISIPPGFRNLMRFRLWTVEWDWRVWAVVLVIIFSDVATTFVGAKNHDPNDIQILVQFARNNAQLAAYAFAITFLPDRLCRWGWHEMTGR